MRELTWIGSVEANGAKSRADVSFRKLSDSIKRKNVPRAAITIRNGCGEQISRSGYLIMAIDGSRLYFRDGKDSPVALKSVNKTANYYMQFTNPFLVDFVKEHIGDYRMKFDKELRLYYVDTEDKL